jgi:tetratricopeptide (TPR) repeat protein
MTTPKHQLVTAIVKFLQKEATNSNQFGTAAELIKTSEFFNPNTSEELNLLELVQRASSSKTSSNVSSPTSSKSTSAFPYKEVLTKSTYPFEKDKRFKDFMTALIEKKYFQNIEPTSEEYRNRLDKAKDKFLQKLELNKQKAEEYKEQGNNLLKDKKFQDAAALYQKAIELFPTPIYYSNLSVAMTSLGDLKGALDAALKSIEIDSEYAKGFGRVANAYFNIENFTEAKKYFELALTKDSDNKTYKEGLLKAQEKIAQLAQQASRSPPMSSYGGDRSRVDLSNMTDILQNSGMTGLLKNSGLMRNVESEIPDMKEALQDPDLMENIQPGEFAKLHEALENPDLMRNVEQFMQQSGMTPSEFGQGDGEGKIKDFLGNPDVMKNIQQLMQQPGMMDMARNMFSNLSKNPDFLNQMKSAISSIPGGKNIPKQVINELKQTEEYRRSAKIKKFVQELEQNGAQAWADNMTDEEIMRFIQKLGAKKMNGNPNLFGAGNTGGGSSSGGSQYDGDDASNYYM